MLLVFFYLVSERSICQKKESYRSISGVIKSAQDSSGVAYADVYLLGEIIGTISNTAGEFELNIPDSLAITEIHISCVGYKTKVISIANTQKIGTVYLEPQTTLLKEVVVSAHRIDSSIYFLEKAIQFIKFNYPKKNHLLEGFFRTVSVRDTIPTRLIEAAIRVQETSYGKDTWDDENLEMFKNRVKVLEIRKSFDRREKDLFTKAMNLLLGERNDLYEILGKNYVRLIGKDGNHIMSKNNLFKYDLELVGKTELDGNEVVIVSIKDQRVDHFQWAEITLYINPKDYAIVRIELITRYNPNRKDIPADVMIDGKFSHKSEISYRKINHKYLPVYIHSIGADRDASHFAESDGRKQRQYSDQMFLVTNVYEGRFEKIKWREAEERHRSIEKIEQPYNEQFWKNYNTVKLNPLKRNTKDLERNKPLTEQFKNHD